LTKTLSNFDIKALTIELEQTVTGKRIDNVYQPRPDLFLIRLRPNGHDLLIEVGKRLHLTNYEYAIPKQPSAICMAFRKRLKGSRVERIHQPGFERILILDLDRSDAKRHLVVEFFQKGNLIVTDDAWRIELPLRRVLAKDRRIERAAKYRPLAPAPANPLTVTESDLQKLRGLGSVAVVKGLTKFLGIGGNPAEEILAHAKVPKETPCHELTKGEMLAIFGALKELVLPYVEERFTPVLIYEEENLIDVSPIKPRSEKCVKLVEKATFNQALDEFYAHVGTAAPEEAKEPRKKANEIQRILDFQRAKLSQLETERDWNKRIGDLIYSHYDELRRALRGELQDTRVRVDPASKRAIVDIGGTNFSLFVDRNLFKQAADFYEKSKKAAQKIEGLLKAMDEAESKLAQLGEERRQEPPAHLKVKVKKKWYEKFRWFRSSSDFLVVAGKDAHSNEALVRKYAEDGDLVLHSDIRGAPFVVIKSEGREIDDRTILEAAEMAASYSNAWREGLSAVDVSLVQPGQLSKTAPSGQYLSRGAFVVKGLRKTLKGIRVAIAIGVSLGEDGLRLMAGPPTAIKSRTKDYIEVVPGEVPSPRLAKEILARLAAGAPGGWGGDLRKLSAADIQNLIPTAKGELRAHRNIKVENKSL